jgi:hypothetical protein
MSISKQIAKNNYDFYVSFAKDAEKQYIKITSDYKNHALAVTVSLNDMKKDRYDNYLFALKVQALLVKNANDEVRIAKAVLLVETLKEKRLQAKEIRNIASDKYTVAAEELSHVSLKYDKAIIALKKLNHG